MRMMFKGSGLVGIAGMVAALLVAPIGAQASPAHDLRAFRHYFRHRFPNVPLKAYAQGEWIPGINSKDALSQYDSIMQFAPQSAGVAAGKRLFLKPFSNGKTYASCFRNGGKDIRQYYPYFDKKTGQVVTLESAINACRVKNAEKPLPWKRGKMAQIAAYMASTSAGQPMHISVPDDPVALAAYERGKEFFYAKRGQLNFSCAACHVDHAGQKLRTQTLSPALGMVNGFPVYRAKWGALGTIDRRFIGCNKKVRAKPFKAQSVEYRDLEYFLSYMSNGIPVTGPGYRN